MKRPIIHPLLFSIFPILFLYAQNATEMNFREILLPLVISLVVAIVFILLFNIIFKNFIKSSFVTTFLAIGFYSFGHLTSLLRNSEYFSESTQYIGYLVLLILILFVAILIFTLKNKESEFAGLTQFLNVTVVILVLLQIGMASYVYSNRQEQSSHINKLDPSVYIPEVLPDIYYLIFDGYGREDVLNEMYNYDNSGFLSELEQRGFFIADSSHSNYCATVQSLSSSLNFDYLHSLGKFNPRAFDRTPLAKIIADNRVFQFLKSFDYQTIAFESGHTPTQVESADYYFKPGATLSEFQNILINTTPLSLLLSKTKSQFEIHRDRISYIIDKIGDLKKIRKPKMVFGHLISPHPPFVFTENGDPTERGWPFTFADGDHYNIQGGNIDDYKNGYKNQLKYISQRILTMVDNILENSENPPIIIIQGDHGPGSGLFWEDLPSTNLDERFSILNAYYLPNLKNDSLLTADLSPVNSFRLILREYFKLNLEMLPNSHFYTTRTKPYNFLDITNNLK